MASVAIEADLRDPHPSPQNSILVKLEEWDLVDRSELSQSKRCPLLCGNKLLFHLTSRTQAFDSYWTRIEVLAYLPPDSHTASPGGRIRQRQSSTEVFSAADSENSDIRTENCPDQVRDPQCPQPKTIHSGKRLPYDLHLWSGFSVLIERVETVLDVTSARLRFQTHLGKSCDRLLYPEGSGSALRLVPK